MVWEHKHDLIIPKFLARAFLELTLGYISLSEYGARLREFWKNRWQNLEELMAFDQKNQIPSTFFIAVANGQGLSYRLSDAQYWINRLNSAHFSVGVHGIACDNPVLMKKELEIFRGLSPRNQIGIRMHYLRHSPDMLTLLGRLGYLYDCSCYAQQNPYRVDGLWEFPLHIMDGYMFSVKRRWQNQTFAQAVETTKRLMDSASSQDLKYFTILFHDRYFSSSFQAWKDWYCWLIDWLRINQYSFINYDEAVNELEVGHG